MSIAPTESFLSSALAAADRSAHVGIRVNVDDDSTALCAFLMVLTLIRLGLLAGVSVVFFSHLVVFYSITTELTAWYAIDFTIALLIALAIAAYGFYISLGGEKIFSAKLLED